MGEKKTLKQIRRELGLSQVDFAKKINLSDKTYSPYEIGKLPTPVHILKEISEKFKVDAEDILPAQAVRYSPGEIPAKPLNETGYGESKDPFPRPAMSGSMHQEFTAAIIWLVCQMDDLHKADASILKAKLPDGTPLPREAKHMIREAIVNETERRERDTAHRSRQSAKGN